MNKKFGIRHEDKYAMERRVSITPTHAKKLILDSGLQLVVQQSDKRIFTDEEYLQAGAELKYTVDECDVVFGVKEMPISFFQKNKTYIFFSHVIKGQPYNMPRLKHMIDLGVNLIDYEKVEDEMGRRLIFFGRFAGLAGMINSLWSLGMRYRAMGIETPFTAIRQSHTYNSLEEAREVISKVGMEIATKGLPKEITPLTFGITGYGNVSKGAQEILNLLPIKEISPEVLLQLKEQQGLPNNIVYKVVFEEKHLSTTLEQTDSFDLQHYYQHPEAYKSVFEQYIPHLSCLMNCMYWDDRYPRIVTKEYLKNVSSQGPLKLTVIGDVTCDPNGSIECTHKGTEIEDPVFVYNPANQMPTSGFEGDGILVMAVDILPSELPRESSEHFSNALFKYIPAIVKCDFSTNFAELSLPTPIKNALILHKGKFTEKYLYLNEYL